MESVEEVIGGVRRLQRALERVGEPTAAHELAVALSDFYTTPTEALVGMYEALQRTEIVWGQRLSAPDRAVAQRAIVAAKRLMNLQ